MINDSSIDIIKLVKSAVYTSINKYLIDKTLLDTNTDKKTLNKEIKKLDKAFIETGSRQKDKEFYCSMSNIKLQNVGDKITVKDFMKLSKSNSKKACKIILNVPYFSLSLNEKQILLPRNILLEVLSIEDNKYTLVAKAKKLEQFKVVKDSKDPSIKADLYDIEGVTLSIQKHKKLLIGGGVLDALKKAVMSFIGEHNKVTPFTPIQPGVAPYDELPGPTPGVRLDGVTLSTPSARPPSARQSAIQSDIDILRDRQDHLKTIRLLEQKIKKYENDNGLALNNTGFISDIQFLQYENQLQRLDLKQLKQLNERFKGELIDNYRINESLVEELEKLKQLDQKNITLIYDPVVIANFLLAEKNRLGY
jgi:hypothetical protein